jgi:hypothetical protein
MCSQIDGTIVAPSDPTTWPANSKRNWLIFYKAHGVSLSGAGLIDGKGQKWWDLPCKPHKGGDTHGPCDSPVVSGLTQPRILTVLTARSTSTCLFVAVRYSTN